MVLHIQNQKTKIVLVIVLRSQTVFKDPSIDNHYIYSIVTPSLEISGGNAHENDIIRFQMPLILYTYITYL